MKAFQVTGVWWLPEAPANRVAGTFAFNEKDGPTLSLIGGFRDRPIPWADDTRYPAILGAAYGHPNSQTITLRDCWLKSSKQGVPGYSQETYQANFALLGAHLGPEQGRTVRAAIIRLNGLEKWVGRATGIQVIREGEEGWQFQAGYRMVPHLVAKVPAGEVTLGLGSTFSNSLRRTEIAESAYFQVRCDEPLTLEELGSQFVWPLHNLLTLAFDAPVALQELQVATSKGESEVWVEVVGQSVFADDEEQRGWPIFTAEQFSARFEEMVRRWLEAAKRYTQAFNVYFSSRYRPDSLVETRFLAAAEGLELYFAARPESQARLHEEQQRTDRLTASWAAEDRGWLLSRLADAPLVSFAEMVRILAREHQAALRPVIGEDAERFVQVSAAARAYVLHGREAAGLHLNSGEILYWHTERLRALMTSCLLAELGMTAEERLGFFTRNPYTHHLIKQFQTDDRLRQPVSVP